MFKILLVEHQPVTLTGLKFIIKKALGEAEVHLSLSVRESLPMLKANNYQLIIVGPNINIADGEMLTLAKICGNKKKLSFIIFIEDLKNLPVGRLLGDGLKGVLDRRSRVDEVEEAVRSACNGKLYMSEKLRAQFIKSLFITERPFQELSPKENVIAKMLAEGKGNKQISEMLNLKPTTISTFKARIFLKLHVSNLVELAEMQRKDGAIKLRYW